MQLVSLGQPRETWKWLGHRLERLLAVLLMQLKMTEVKERKVGQWTKAKLFRRIISKRKQFKRCK
jgi:hypothetical protein